MRRRALCAAQLSRIEKAICSGADLASWDTTLAWVYEKQRSTYASDQRAALITEQRVWLANRKKLCPDENPTACLKALYEKRTRDLGSKLPQYQRGFGPIEDSHIALVPSSGWSSKYSAIISRKLFMACISFNVARSPAQFENTLYHQSHRDALLRAPKD